MALASLRSDPVGRPSRAVLALVGLALASLVAVLMAPPIARAEDLVVVALGGNASEAERAPVLAEVVRRFEAEGFAVLGPAELLHRVPPSRLALRSTEDAARLAADQSVPRVACVSVWVEAGAVHELSLSLHALSGARSVRESTATGAITAEAGLEAVLTAMVGRVLAAERAAVMLDPGSALGSASDTGSGSASDTGSGSASASGSGSGSGGVAGSGTDPGPEPLFGILGPGLLAAIGAAGIGLGIWAVLDPTCDRRGVSGVCLRGEDNNVGVGVVLLATGALSLAGSIFWWITGARAPESEPRIDVVLGPGTAGVRGSF